MLTCISRVCFLLVPAFTTPTARFTQIRIQVDRANIKQDMNADTWI